MRQLILLLFITTFSISAFSQKVCVDIIVDSPSTNLQGLVFLGSKTWKPGDNLKVKFLGGNKYVQEQVKKYAVEWTRYASITLTFVDSGYADIRISFAQNNQSWSLIGRDSETHSVNLTTGNTYPGTDGPSMNFGWFNETTSELEFKRTTLHEFGHALGAFHEHQAPINPIKWNKPVVYAYYMNPPNSWSKDKVDVNIFQRYSVTQTIGGEYDKDSIMHYPIPKEHTLDDYFVGWNNSLSLLDKKYMADVYPNPVSNQPYFKSIAATENGVFYAVNYIGEMRWYKYIGINGEDKWAKGSGNVISRGWNSFKYILAGKNGMIFGIATNGDMYWYQYLGTQGEENWEVGSRTKVSAGWNSFIEVVIGGDNNFFAVSANGDMLWYKYTGQKGQHTWAKNSQSKISSGWNSFTKIFADKNNQIFAITKTGKLLWYRYNETNGSGQFSKNSGSEISSGWESFRDVVAGEKGQIFAVTKRGEMIYYNYVNSDGLGNWGVGTTKPIRSGW